MKTKAAVKVFMRWMIRRDLPEVLATDAASFGYPWSDDDFIRELQRRNCIGMVAESRGNGSIVGFMLYDMHKTRLQPIRMAVHPQYRRQGVGCAMCEKLKSKLSTHRRTALTFDLREANLCGQLFLRSQGFKCVGVTRECWPDSGEDAFVFRYDLPSYDEI